MIGKLYPHLSLKHSFLFKKIVCAWLVLAVVLSQVAAAVPISATTAYAASEESEPETDGVTFGKVADVSSTIFGDTAYAANGGQKIEKAEKPNPPTVIYDLIAVIVDKELDQDNTSYDGLKAAYPEFADELSDNKLGHRILRYAEDIRKNNDLTDVKILFFDKSKDTVNGLSNALENLYRNGDGTNTNRLRGVVLIGDIPLPVVNKNGNRYISMFPYTDFSEKAYIYNETSKSFERNNSVGFPKPEIWHGVIRAPTANFNGRQKLAEFFDKSHLYYEGEPLFSKFDRKMFFGDLANEESQVNPDVYKRYVKYLAAIEDLTYMRYNKFWASEVSKETISDLPEQAAGNEFIESLKNTDPLANLPDIYAKQIIDQNLLPYYKVLGKYFGKVNDWADYTARYAQTPDGRLSVDTVAGMVTIKDEYTKYYLKSVNDALEKKINEIAGKIQEPISIAKYSSLSGGIGAGAFSVNVFDSAAVAALEEAKKNNPGGMNLPQPWFVVDKIYYNFHYNNEKDGKFYVNGIDADILNSPKQCAPFLGSTKSEYFDTQTLDFNPKATGGEYSILTRSLRSDNLSNAASVHTVGVNTRMLSPVSIGGEQSDLFKATNGKYAGSANEDGTYNTGAIVEDNPEYGISAFIHNPLSGNYEGPVEKELQKGDVIIKVNNENLNFANSFDQAIEKTYSTLYGLIDAVNHDKLEQLNNFTYPIKIIPGESLQQSDINAAVGYFSIEFYRDGNLMKKYFSFSVDKNGSTTTADPKGNPELYLLLDTPPGINFDQFDILDPQSLENLKAEYEKKSQGAIFTLYKNKGQGYKDKAYDPSAGCNASSTMKNSDRCFGMIAAMPVLDVAGSTAPVKMNIPGVGSELKFPEKVKKNNKNENSGKALDYEKHVDSYQFPGGGKNDYYQYEDIDDVYYNSCYAGLPSPTTLAADSNPYGFPLDSSTASLFAQAGVEWNKNLSGDFYGNLLDSFGAFVSGYPSGEGGDLSDDADYVKGDSMEDSSDFSPREKIWLNMDKLDASQIVLNTDPKVTLEHFADRYGLFDGIDNDNDGLTDYKLLDQDNDGIFETKFYDFDEADPKYGIPSWNLSEIARKLLSHDSTYTIPYGLDGFPYDTFDLDITLQVDASEYKTISSVIIHNEPTDFTISEQIKSQTAFSLPIDNPRYVAFQSKPMPGPGLPVEEPEGQYYYPGQTQKINYVNLFSPDVRNMAQLTAALTAKADEIAAVPGSYRIFGEDAKEDDYTPVQIKDKILNDYLMPVVSGALDDPVQGFNLKIGSSAKIYDALKWLDLNIDEKHEYILQYYLNGDSKIKSNAYVNDGTLLPAPEGFEPAYGYEAAYLVLNGEKNYFDMAFNKDLPEETDGKFDPLSQELGAEGEWPEGEPPGDGGGGGGGGENPLEFFEFVWIQDWLKELDKFVNFLTTVPDFEAGCGSIDWIEEEGDDEEVEENAEFDQNLEVNADANDVQLFSYVYTDIEGFDELTAAIESGVTEAEWTGAGEGGAGEGSDGAVEETGGGSADGGGGDEGQGGEVGDTGALDSGTGAKKSGSTGSGTTGEIVGSGNEGTGAGGDKAGGEGGNSEGESGIGGVAGGAVGGLGTGETVGETGTEDSTDKNLEILESTPVEETTLESTPVETESAEDLSQPKIEKEQTWEEYFMLKKYYQKFLNQKISDRSKWLAAAFSDNPFIDSENNDESKYIIDSGGSMIADDHSLMKIDAQIFDTNGKLETKKSLNVKFSLSKNLVSFDGNNVVKSQNGIATVYLKAGKKAGDFKIKAEVIKADGSVDKNYQIPQKDLHLLAGDPAKIEIKSDSYALVANGQSKTALNFILKDKFGNVANDSFSQVVVFVDGNATIDEKADTNKDMVGVQLSTFDGKATIDLSAGDQAGESNITAFVLDPLLEEELTAADLDDIDFTQYIGATKKFQILDKVNLSLKVFDENFEETNSIVADGESIARLGVKLLHNGQTLTEYSGPINFTIINGNLGGFVNDPPEKMANGELNSANATFKSSTLAGDAEVLVNVPGFVTDSFKFKTTHSTPTTIELTASQNSLNTNSQDEVILQARLLDKNGNLALNNSGTPVTFKATDATKDLVIFDPANALTLNGVASTKIFVKDVSGVANIIAKSEGIKSGTISLKINKHITDNEVKNFAPRALYVSLLGGAFGKTTDQNNLANAVLFGNGGQVQAVSSVTATPKDKKLLFGVDGYGKVDILTDTVITKVIQATNSFPYQKVDFSEEIMGDELGSVFVVPKADTPLKFIDDDKAEIPSAEGIYVKVFDAKTKNLFIQKDDGIYLEKDGDTKVKIDNFGRIFINDDVYKLRLATKDDNIYTNDFTLILSKGAVTFVSISFRQNFGGEVKELSSGDLPGAFFPGIYVQPASSKKKYQFVPAFSGVSTSEPYGKYMIDTESEIDPGQAPGFGFSSLENGGEEFGLGFEGDNKHMLLFASGNSVGESLMPYASDTGVIYGDPTIRLKIDDDLISQTTGYTKDLGKPIFSGQEQISQVVDFDFNGDGYDDLLLVYEDGLIRLLENEISNERFRDRGYVINIYNGIFSLAKIDVNNDGYDDLIVGTKESCNVGEECISLLKNYNGNLERESLNLALSGKKAYEMKAGDMNADGCEDLAVSDSSGDINIFYNQNDGESCTGLNTNYGYSKSFGFNINEELNQADNLFINYPGMEVPDNGKSPDSNWYKFIQFTLESSEPPAPVVAENGLSAADYAADAAGLQNTMSGSPNISTKDIPSQTYPKKFDFIHIKQDGKFFLNSTKQAKDLNGGTVALGDEIEYLIALKNDSGKNVNNLMLSDATPTSMTLFPDSLQCLDANCPDQLEWMETGTSLRSHIIKNLSVPAHGQRIIKYKMRVEKMPKVHFDIGNDFVEYPSNNNDPYLDIMVKPEVNPDGVLTYLYSTGPQTYAKMQVSPADSQENVLDKTFEKLGLPSPTELLSGPNDEPSPEVKKQLAQVANRQAQDTDYDGCADSWKSLLSDSKNTGEAVADSIESAIGNLRCSGGGCAPIPYNKAFLVPDGATPGFAALAIGTPSIPYVYPASSSVSSFLRLYISPTLTLGLGTAVCAGPSIGLNSPCYAFAISGGIPGSKGACKKLLGGVDKALSYAKNSLVDPAVGQAAVITDGEGATNDPNDVNMGGNFGDENDPVSASSKVNIKIPGFPGVITDWLDAEVDEIYNKLLDFPTFYFVLPDFDRMAQETKLAGRNFSFSSFHDFATSISNFPFVKLEGKEIVIKVPAISRQQIEKYKQQWKAWKKHMKREMDKIVGWDCGESEEKQNLCDKILLNMQDFVSSVSKMMDTLDQIANLPKDILTWRNLEAKYAMQIICYLDAIINYTGGYINRQQKIIQSWIKTIQDTIKTFKNWKAILDVIAEYQESCDQCKNDRFSKLGILLQFFMGLPDPPVIPLPKWPDTVVDFSQIKTGVTIMWPDVVFRPEPIILPNIPTIILPDILPPDMVIDIPGFDFNVPDFSKFTLPDFPDLPPLPLPKLPDLPNPPKIPNIPNVVKELMANIKFIFKILCLLKNGIVPVPEWGLATEIETLTQPSVQAVLPIIKNLGIQLPAIEYSYVDQIKITGKLNFDIDTNFIYLVAEYGAKLWDEKMKALVRNLNKYTTFPYEQVINKALQKAADKAKKEAVEGIVGEDKESSLPLASIDLHGHDMSKMEAEFSRVTSELNNYVAQLKKEQSQIPDTYYLTADQTFIDHSDPMLNRSLAEIEDDIKLENLPDAPGIKQLADLRGSLISYTKNLNSTNEILEDIDDANEFNKILVENDQSSNRIAEVPARADVESGDGYGESKTLEFSFFGEKIEQEITQALNASEISRKRDLIAAAIDFDPKEYAHGEGQKTPPPIGFYVAAGDSNENVLNYTAELKGKTNVLFNDVDHDNDYDIILSLNGDVYLKESHKNKPDLPEGDLIVGLNKNKISDYVADGGDSVQGIDVPYTGNGKVDISWLPKDTVEYQVILRKSIYDDFEDAIYIYSVKVADLTDKNSPSMSLEIPNGNYYVNVFAVDEDGNKSLASDTMVVAPQSCADSEAPMPVVSTTEYEVSVLKDIEIDASASFDPDGKIKQYFIEPLLFESSEVDPNTNQKLKTTQFPQVIWSDLNVLVDDNNDSIAWNDKNNPKFKLGPFVNEGDIGKHGFVLHTVDESGKDATIKITVNVFAPKITLDETFARTLVASGETDPKVSTLPFWLMRSRYIYRVIDGKLKIVPRVDKVKDGLTDEDGAYSIEDFNLDDMILVETADKEIIAEIHPKTGNIGALKPGYSTVVNEAVPPVSPTSVDIVNANGQTLGTVYMIADINVDVQVYQNFGFTAENTESLHGVSVDDLASADDFEFIKLPASDPGNPGGVILIYKTENKPMVSVDPAGNILILDKRITLTKKPNDHVKDPLLIQINFEGKLVAEIYISTGNPGIIVGPDDVPFSNPRKPSDGALKGSVFDFAPYDDLNYIIDPSFDFGPEDLVKRKDFVRVLLRMICVVPRPESYDPFAAGTGYSDNLSFGEYHPDIKEATLLTFVDGYKGEPDPGSGLFPFKPQNTITRAESVKIILKALEFKGLVDLSEVTEGNPWYGDYMKAGLDLTPYLKNGMPIKNNFIVTSDEAADPYKLMTFEELLTMVQRVLDIYNCFKEDVDKDTMSDFCEAKYKIDDPAKDEDQDGLSNADECYYKLDPTDDDTDKGGVKDGKEMQVKTNPLDPADDTLDEDNDGLSGLSETTVYFTDPYNPDTDSGGKNDGKEVADCTDPLDLSDDDTGSSCKLENEAGIYIVPAECNSCPCISTFLHKADIIPGDQVFPVIGVDYDEYYEAHPTDKTYIFSKGNEVTIESVNK